MTLKELRSVPLIYLATPYSRYPMGYKVAYYDACRLSADLLRAGLNVFSPIAHSHAISTHGHIDPLDHEFWMAADKAFMAKADALLIGRLDGWDRSTGVTMEMAVFRAANKPIYHVDPATLEVVTERAAA